MASALLTHSIQQVDFRGRVALGHSSAFCNHSAVGSRGILIRENWTAVSPWHSLNIGSKAYRCTEHSVLEDWSSGESLFTFAFPYAGPWQVR